MDPVKQRWHRQQMEAYTLYEPVYQQLAEKLEEILEALCAPFGPSFGITKRAKERHSFSEKILRKYDKYKNPLEQMTDLAGARVVLYTLDQVDQVCEAICREKGFRIDYPNCIDTRRRLHTGEFGYLAVHFIVQLDADTVAGVQVPPSLLPHLHAHLPHSLKAEIQVCTVLQHVWSAIGHDRVYKSEMSLPLGLERRLCATAALLETADREFAQAIQALDTYSLHHDAYLTARQIEEAACRWEAVVACCPGDSEGRRRLGRLQLTMEHWQEAYRTLEPLRASTLLSDRLLCAEAALAAGDLGVAQGLLQTILTTDPRHWSALLALGATKIEARSGPDFNHALQCYRDAFCSAPNEPAVLAPFVECEIRARGNLDALPLLIGSLEDAIETCKARASRNVYLPDAHFNRGRFHLYLGRPFEALDAYTRAVVACNTVTPIRREREAIKRIIQAGAPGQLHDHLELCQRDSLRHYEWVRMFLRLAELVKTMQMIHRLQANIEDLHRQLAEHQAARDKSSAAAASTGLGPSEQLTHATEACEHDERARAVMARIKRDENEVLELRATLPPLREAIKPYTTSGRCGYCAPVVIVAGGCDAAVASRIHSYAAAFQGAFEGFCGTVIGGGTTAGVSGMVAGLPNAALLNRVGYLPPVLPAGDQEDDRYDCLRHTFESDEYTPAGPLQLWADLLYNGFDFREVRLFGINGGDLSAFEFRLAVALGGSAAIVEDSGRKAEELLDDDAWHHLDGLIPLPFDAGSWTAFINGHNPLLGDLGDQEATAAARFVHAGFVEQNRSSDKKHHAGVLPWDVLDDVYKDSNLRQVRYALFILHRAGFTVVADPTIDPDNPPLPLGFDHRIEFMAELEHGRFCADRLASGWRYGLVNDKDLRTNPTLVPWIELSNEDKEFDRQAIQAYPKWLARAGLRIQ